MLFWRIRRASPGVPPSRRCGGDSASGRGPGRAAPAGDFASGRGPLSRPLPQLRGRGDARRRGGVSFRGRATSDPPWLTTSRADGAPSPGLSPNCGGEVTRAETTCRASGRTAQNGPPHTNPSPAVGGGVGRRREERAKRRPGERAPSETAGLTPRPSPHGVLPYSATFVLPSALPHSRTHALQKTCSSPMYFAGFAWMSAISRCMVVTRRWNSS